MNIKTKYEIGTHIWFVYENRGEVHVYDDYIVNIVIDEDKQLLYTSKCAYEEFKEEEVILYEELDKMAEKVKQLMQEIKEKEGSKDDNKAGIY